MTAVMSVVVPAHNEQTIIERMLRALVASDTGSNLEIVVVANGCTDDTARVAGEVAPSIRVVQIATASKIAALNAGDDAATVFPRAYVDADVRVSAEALLAVAERLDDAAGTFIGAPRLRIDTAGCSLAVRQYYTVWEQSEYRAAAHVGSGVYVLSKSGRERFGRFPDLIADDRFVQQLFAPTERVTAAEHSFTVPAPRTYRALLSRQTRIATGNRQLAHAYPPRTDVGQQPRFGALVKRVAARPALWPAFGSYCYGYLVPRLLARRMAAAGQTVGWNRDETTRVSA